MGLFIKIINDGTGSKSYGNYNYKIMINDRIIEQGELSNYCRAKGAIQLAKEIIFDAERKELDKLVKVLNKE